jgi:hypothetical protein
MSAEKNTTASLVLRSAEKIKPKPTKGEIIKALAARRFDQLLAIHEEKHKAHNEKRVQLEKAVAAHVRKELLSLPPRVYLGSLWKGSLSTVRVEVELADCSKKLPEKLKAEIIAWHAVEVAPRPDLDKITQEVREAYQDSADQRVDAMLKQPAIVAALDQTLSQLGLTSTAPH